MKTNVLLITNKGDITTDFIVRELKSQHISFYRLNTEEITKSISLSFNIEKSQYLVLDIESSTSYDCSKFTSVYYRRPEIPGISIEGLTYGEEIFIRNEHTFFLEGFYKILKNAFWFSPVYSIREAENKVYQLIKARELGFQIPKSILTTNYQSALEFYNLMNSNCIIKPIKSGLISEQDHEKVVFTSKIAQFPESPASIQNCPSYLQELIEKKSDLRVTVVGNKIFATEILSQENEDTKIDWRRGENILIHRKVSIPKDIEKKCVKLVKDLNLKFGAIDFIIDKNGKYIFLEINPNGQWAWIEYQTKYPISKEIVEILKNGKNQTNT
jgi:glutathione synthase/RimK-type ligase-like ATP-grasp enzyme